MFPQYIPKEIIESTNAKFWLSNIEPKSITIPNFEIETNIKFDNIPVLTFKNSLTKKIDDLKNGILNLKYPANLFYQMLVDFKKIIADENTLSNFKMPKDLSFQFQDSGFPRTIKITQGASIYKAYQYILDNIKKYLVIDIDSKKMDSPEYNLFLKRKDTNDKLYLVHSTNPIDILMMSSRSYWTSCQNIFEEKSIAKFKTLNAAFDPDVSVMYLTNKKSFKDRGDEYIARCLVSVIHSKYDNSEIILLSNVYGNVNYNQFMDLAVKELQARTNKRVVYMYHPQEDGVETNFECNDYYKYIHATKEMTLEPYSDISGDTLNVCLLDYTLNEQHPGISEYFVEYKNLNKLSTKFKTRYFNSKIRNNVFTERFIEHYKEYLNWDLMCEHQNISCSIIEKYFDNINFQKLAKNKYLSKNVVEKYKHLFPFEIKIVRLKYSELELKSMIDSYTVGLIFRNQTLSFDFIKNNKIITDFLDTLGNKHLYIKKYQKHLSNEQVGQL